MQVEHRRTYVRLGPTEGFKHWKDLEKFDHIEGEDGQTHALSFMSAFAPSALRDKYLEVPRGTAKYP